MADSPAPTPSESTASMLAAYQKYFPGLMKINAQNILPTEQAKLEATRAISPGYSELQQQLYDAYGPLLAETGNRINAQNAEAGAQSDLNVVKGTGRDLVKEAIETQKLADPEYYRSREQMGGRLGDLLSSIDLSGKLSGGEREALSRGQAQANQTRGISTNPSQTAALENALNFGEAGHQRQNEAKAQLGGALSVGNQFLPASQSGMDVFKVATGKSSMPNAGDAKFRGVTDGIGDTTTNTGNMFLNNISQLTQQGNDINANRRDVLDRMNEVTNSVGSIS
jgi:hypothetical protein